LCIFYYLSRASPRDNSKHPLKEFSIVGKNRRRLMPNPTSLKRTNIIVDPDIDVGQLKE
jgi:hypothetical protein